MRAEVNSIVRDVRNAQRRRLGLSEVEHDGRDDIDAYIQAGGTVAPRNDPEFDVDTNDDSH